MLAVNDILNDNIDFDKSLMAEVNPEENNPDVIIGKYKQMMSECQQIASKIQELNLEKDEHRLVIDQLSKLDGERKAFRLVGGILVERTVGEVFPVVSNNFEGIKELITKLDATLKVKDQERRIFKDKHGIMTQEEREAIMKQQGLSKK